ncbi:tyrosine-type recombinase/integrase [Aneurinibacillus sp. BA2021]|nr:tyrosine-type recombinase/integrase [Aneurinibacillus sp. BA2021]
MESFKFLATMGMRRLELVDLNWEHIDFGTNAVRVMRKRSKERLLPLHASVTPLFISYRNRCVLISFILVSLFF